MKIQVLDLERIYYLRVPTTYDANRPYPIIFRWHGRGGDGLSGGLGIEFSARNDAIVVGADGLDGTWDRRMDSANLAFFDQMLEVIESRYCIDRNRILSYGFSVGGYFSNLLACKRGRVLRASAVVAGGLRDHNCMGKVARWFLHDLNDRDVPIAQAIAARNQALVTNRCSVKSVAVGEGCVRYLGCDGAPVVWCESVGYGHNIRGDFAPAQVWRFFRSLQ